MPISTSKLRQIGLLWVLALGLSALLVAAGRHWPAPPIASQSLVWTLLLLPPLAMGLWLLGRWTLPIPGQEGQSEATSHEQQ